eukprot:TRINITY_DN12076_c0_g1_i2.p1 TRINITY_DN12076_c0_g1~~TRINITY_DN12076_c0_g1_i2.p1  ORF type:complete len:237 (+),score=44.75 TRINITY_DN12076_c0_g1_i2:580-1290(+)
MANALAGTNEINTGPRAILKRQLEKLEKSHATATIEASIDFYLFNEQHDKITNKHSPSPYILSKKKQMLYITEKQQLFLNDIISTSLRSGLRVTSVEVGEDKGQITAHFAASRPMEIADNITLFKKAMHQMALDKDMSATFMAMPDMAKSPSKLSLHISLLKDGSSLLTGKEDELMQIGKELVNSMPLQCTNANSYKRLSILKKKSVELVGDTLDALISVCLQHKHRPRIKAEKSG